MNRSTSLYLDFLRASAALIVFLFHASLPFFSQGQTWIPQLGHEMVIVFFVLSGFVIAFTHTKYPDSVSKYFVDRSSRMYSVVFPALILTAVLDQIGMRVDPSLYEGELPDGYYWPRLLLAGGFMSQTWGISSRAGSNSPLWSLSYEVWYYLFFGVVAFARSRKWLLLGVVAWLVLAGPKIALLLPVWLMGVVAFHASRRKLIDSRWAGPTVVVATSLLVAVFTGALDLPGTVHAWNPAAPLFFSGQFRTDYQLGFLVALQIVATDAWFRLRTDSIGTSPFVRPIRFAAGCSFSLYVFHQPLLVFARATIPFDGSSTVHVLLVLILILLIVIVLAEITEKKREPWRRFFQRMQHALTAALRTRTGCAEVQS